MFGEDQFEKHDRHIKYAMIFFAVCLVLGFTYVILSIENII